MMQPGVPSLLTLFEEFVLVCSMTSDHADVLIL